jgi:hypothetical protein
MDWGLGASTGGQTNGSWRHRTADKTPAASGHDSGSVVRAVVASPPAVTAREPPIAVLRAQTA